MSSVTDTVLDYGDQALLLEFDSTAEVLAWTAALREAAMPGVLDIVPAARTVLLKLDGPGRQSAVRRRLRHVAGGSRRGRDRAGGEPTVIDVVYDGADLAEVAELTGMTTAQVIDAHTANPWKVGFCGFAPGFAYLVGGDPRLDVPRRSEPRPSVPAGAVGLAGEFTGIYPRRSPGGWQLIGHTDAVLWDIDRSESGVADAGHVGPVPGRIAEGEEGKKKGGGHDDAGNPAHRTAGPHRRPRPRRTRPSRRHPVRGGRPALAQRWPTGWWPTRTTAPPSR